MAQSTWEPVDTGSAGGWVVVEEGWEEPVEVVPWGDDGFAIGLNVYGMNGGIEPRLVRAGLAGVQAACALAPEGTLGGLATADSGGVWVVWNAGAASTTSPDGSSQTTLLAYYPHSGAEDMLSPTVGPVACPWSTPWVSAEAIVATEDGGALVVGWGLDPCCTHRELPFFWKVQADGSPDPNFGWGGIAVVDVAGTTTVHPPGNPYHETEDTPNERHDTGGFLSSLSPTENGWVAGGGVSNGSTYELLLVRIDTTGQLLPEFGDGGLVRMNAYPGMSHYVDDVTCVDGQTLALVHVPPNAESESGCVVWAVQASGASGGWEEAPFAGFTADRWELAHGQLWAVGQGLENGRCFPAGAPWTGGFECLSPWPAPTRESAPVVRAAWHPGLEVLATVVQLSGALLTEADWAFRAWSPWVSDMLHK